MFENRTSHRPILVLLLNIETSSLFKKEKEIFFFQDGEIPIPIC